MSWLLKDIRDQSLKLNKIGRNLACIWPPIFWWAPPEFLDLQGCNIKHTSFRSCGKVSQHSQSAEGARRFRGEKTSRVKHKPVPGGLINEPVSYHKIQQAVARKHNKPRPRVAHRGIARFLRIDEKCNQVIPWSLHTFPENFMQIGSAVCL